MIRQDYLVRLIQQITEALVRVLSLKQQMNYAGALSEVDEILARLRGGTAAAGAALTLEDLIDLCLENGGHIGEQLSVLADLYSERAELLRREGRAPEAPADDALALGLNLEAMQRGFVFRERLEKVERLIARTEPVSAGLHQRLMAYYEARGMFGRAENALFRWIECGPPEALQAGHAFYDRLKMRSDEELAQGDLPRAEINEGREMLDRYNG